MRSLIAAATACQVQVPFASQSRDRSFDADWRWHRGDAPGAEQTAFDDSGFPA